MQANPKRDDVAMNTTKMQTQEKPELLVVNNLTKYFPVRSGVFQRVSAWVQAVDKVSFAVKSGETLGMVGESGCGKTTVGRSILRLVEPTSGEVTFNGENIITMRPKSLKALRRDMQIIFQDPYASLNPRMPIGEAVMEGLQIHKIGHPKERWEIAINMLKKVGLEEYHARRYPHEFSGGQRQRIGIARALALQPSFIVCDEPISALDVSIQAQVVNLLEELQDQFNLTYLFIAHDLSMVRHISKRIAVMYLGVIMELAERDELYLNPLHPYTQALLSAVPIPDPIADSKRKRVILEGDVPSPVNPPSGCRFRTRCPIADKVCAESRPEFREVTPGHFVACHLVK